MKRKSKKITGIKCPDHSCEKLECGCPTEVLFTGYSIDTIRAKDKWIEELLQEREKLYKLLEKKEGGLF